MFTENRFMEILIIGALALIVVGPKDLPILMRKVGQFVGRMRGMAAEFRASFDELARQSELDELRKEVEAMRVNQSTLNQLNPLADDHSQSIFGEIDHQMRSLPQVEQITPVVSEPAPEVPEAAPVKPKRPRASRAKAPKAASDAS